MKFGRKALLVGGAVLALAAGGGGTAVALSNGGNDDGDVGATGPGADAARTKALSLYPGGKANSVERDSENGATWEVEVTKADGKTVDVRLGRDLGVVVVEGDSEDAGGK